MGLGISFVAAEPQAVGHLLSELPAGAVAVLLDAPDQLRRSIDVWNGAPAPPALELMRRVKARFDPAQVCNPGVYVGGI